MGAGEERTVGARERREVRRGRACMVGGEWMRRKP